jgi:hypothetical protein
VKKLRIWKGREIYLRAVVDLEEGHAQDTIFEVNIEDAVSVALMNWIPASASSTAHGVRDSYLSYPSLGGVVQL